ncbi:polysaccharide deacetylase family protein [Brevibacillus ginsengisoli]|uniref:polysaccharide deacetylase family protein n=1 Tax=Brevibacillus ginsengisoli TaxID=363854 RepID=UPI003CEDF5E1
MKKSILRWGTVIILFVAVLYITYDMMNSRTFQVFGEIVPRVETTQKAVALTIDDGPNGKADKLIHLLEEEKIKATFFLIGQEMEKYPQETVKLIQAGHEIGNHSYSHQRMVLKTPGFIQNEIERTDTLIHQAGYQGDILFRPPYGKKLFLLPYYLNKTNRKSITWDIEPDSDPQIASSTDRMINYVVHEAKPGSIILLHGWHYSDEEASHVIRGIVGGLREQGYTFLTVSELMLLRGK